MDQADQQTSSSILRNITYGSLAWLLPLGLNLVAVPTIVASMGHAEYGVYALILGFVAYSFTFNFGRAITKYIAEYRILGETEKMNDVISASLFLCLAVGIFGAVVMCLSARWLVTQVFLIDPLLVDRSVIAMYLAAVIILLTMLSQIFYAVLQGVQRFDVYSKILTANSVALIGGNLVLAFLGYGLLALLVWNLVTLSIFCLLYGIAAKRMLPGLSLRFQIERKTLKLVISFSAGIVGYQLLANILLLFERSWITQRLGSESLTFYVVPMSLGLILHGFISSLVIVIFPLASELTHEREKLLKLYLKATKMVSVLVVFVVLSLIVQRDVFLHLWMGDDFARNSSELLVLHMICFGLMSIMTISWQMTEGLGHPRFIAASTGVCSLIGVILLTIIVDPYGNMGAAAARLIAFGLIFTTIFVIERMFFSKVQTRFWLRLTGNLGAAAIAAALAEYLVMSRTGVEWVGLATSVLIGGLAYCCVLWLLDFISADEKLLLKQVFNR